MHCWFNRVLLPVAAAIVTCAAAAQPAVAAPLKLATFQCDATPPLGGGLVTVERPLLAKGIVLEDGQARYAMCVLDWCTLGRSRYIPLRQAIAEAAGTDVSRVAVHSTHVHTDPGLGQPGFLEEVVKRLGAAVRASLPKLQPFDQVGMGEGKVDRVASTRRIIMPDGTIRVRGSMGGTRPELAALPEGLIDPMLKTITFARGDKPLARLHYYATHPQTFYGDKRASYDMPGIARERLQDKENVFQIYFSGCGGNITVGKYNNTSPDKKRRYRDELTGRLYAGMEAAVAATRLIPVERIEWRTVPVEFPGLEPIELSLLKLGPAHALHLPGDTFVEFQLFAQQVLPDEFVAVAGYGDFSTSYICTKKAFSEGGYEPTMSKVGPGAEKLLKAAISTILSKQ